jgi:hypothetical protein
MEVGERGKVGRMYKARWQGGRCIHRHWPQQVCSEVRQELVEGGGEEQGRALREKLRDCFNGGAGCGAL